VEEDEEVDIELHRQVQFQIRSKHCKKLRKFRIKYNKCRASSSPVKTAIMLLPLQIHPLAPKTQIPASTTTIIVGPTPTEAEIDSTILIPRGHHFHNRGLLPTIPLVNTRAEEEEEEGEDEAEEERVVIMVITLTPAPHLAIEGTTRRTAETTPAMVVTIEGLPPPSMTEDNPLLTTAVITTTTITAITPTEVLAAMTTGKRTTTNHLPIPLRTSLTYDQTNLSSRRKTQTTLDRRNSRNWESALLWLMN